MTLLNYYHDKKRKILAEMPMGKQGSVLEVFLRIQELNYRICVLETFQFLVKSAPITVDITAIKDHYTTVEAYTRLVLSERKFGRETTDEEKKQRALVRGTLNQVTEDCKKRLYHFSAVHEDEYKKAISVYSNTILPVWIQYRNTYMNV